MEKIFELPDFNHSGSPTIMLSVTCSAQRFSFAVSEEDADNFRKNNITARVEAQVTLTVEQPGALIYGDFTAI